MTAIGIYAILIIALGALFVKRSLRYEPFQSTNERMRRTLREYDESVNH